MIKSLQLSVRKVITQRLVIGNASPILIMSYTK